MTVYAPANWLKSRLSTQRTPLAFVVPLPTISSAAFRIVKVQGGAVQPVAGDGTAGYLDADEPMAARFYGLEGLAVTPDGAQLYVADGSRGEALPFNRLRIVSLR